jgi:hypothetical protein
MAGALMFVACGAAGGTDGGGAGLPDRGIVSYDKLAPRPDAEVGFLLAGAGGPAAVRTPEGVALFYDSGGDLYYVSSSDGLDFGEGSAVMQGATEPSVVGTQDGFAQAWVDSEGVRVALSSAADEFGVDPIQTIPGAGSPSLVWSDGVLWVYTVEDGRVMLRRLGADGSYLDDAVVAFGSDEACLDESGDPCWDRMGVDSVEVRRATTPLGRVVYRMMYAGIGSVVNRGIGFAASFDGRSFTRYPFNPVFSESGRESQPSNLLVGDRYLLYFRDRVVSEEGIGVAEIVSESPSDQF